MKLIFHFKDPDAVSETLYDFVRSEMRDKGIDLQSPAGRAYMKERIAELEEKCRKLFEHSEYAKIEADLETGEMRVVPPGGA